MANEIIIEYDTDLELLLKNNAEECECYSLLHRASYEKYNRRSNWINVPVIAVSNLVGFTTALDLGWQYQNVGLGIISIFLGIIKSIDSYFGLPKRAEGHRLCSLQYAQINKRIIVELSLKRAQRQNPKDMLSMIKTDMRNLADIAPLIDQDIITDFKKKYADKTGHFRTNTPNITNGLTPVVINGFDIQRKKSIDGVFTATASIVSLPAQSEKNDLGQIEEM